jgi:tRNA(Ile)-lysidine synthase TilS/MesJ
MTANYFRALATRCRTASRDSLDLFAKEEFRQLATEFNAKDQLDLSSKHPGRVGW